MNDVMVVEPPRIFSGQTLPNVLAYLHYAIQTRGCRDVILDFSKSRAVYEAGMLPMMPIIGRYRAKNKVEFSLKPPADERLRSMFEKFNWAHFIDPFHYEYREQPTDSHCPALRFATSDEQFAAVDKVLGVIVSSFDVSRDVLKAIEWSLNEITDNVINHAGGNAPGYVQATWYRENKVVEFIVADAGIGVPKSLGETDHCHALERAIQEGVTRNKATNQGNGLYGSFRIALQAGGQFGMRSQFADLYLTSDGDVRIRPARVPYKGTTVRWSVRTDVKDLISKALVFSGKPHEPAFDFLDRIVGDADGEVIVSLKKQFPSLGSRDAGENVGRYARNLLQSGGARQVKFDFEGINIISSSFADEVFGRLFVELGPVNFMSRIAFVNADPEILGLINRAIVQRSGMQTS